MTQRRWMDDRGASRFALLLMFAAGLCCRAALADEPPTNAQAPGTVPAEGAAQQGPAPPPGAAVAVFGDDGARLLLDGRDAGTLPLAVPLLVPEGTHKLRLEKGKRAAQAQLKLLANRPVQVRFTLVPSLALVTPTQAALFAPSFGGAVPEAQRQRLLAVVQRAAAQERVLLLPPEQIAAMRAAAPQLAACAPETLQCQERLAAQAEAQYVLLLQVEAEPAQGPDQRKDQKKGPAEEQWRWGLTVKLYDVRASAQAAAQQRECAACTVQRAGQVLAELVGQVAQEGATRPRGSVAVTSSPAGAEVKLDGRLLGPAPARSDAFAGEHEVSLALRGFLPYQARVTVADGQELRVPVGLKQEPVPPRAPVVVVPPPRAPEAAANPFYKKWWFWTGVGVVVTGAVVFSAIELSASPPKEYPNARMLSF